MFFRVPSTAEHHGNFYHNNVPVLIYFSLLTAASKQDAIADAMEWCYIEPKNVETYVGKNNCEKVVSMSGFDMEWCSMECESGELYVRENNCEVTGRVLGVNEIEMEWSSVAFESGVYVEENSCEVTGRVLRVNEIGMDWTSMEFDGGELCVRQKRKLVRRRLNF
jgi:hypothetical protein